MEKRLRGDIMARPSFEKYNIDFMKKKIDEYIESRKKSIPILKECCLLNDWDYDYVMKLQREHEGLRQSIKKLLNWKEVKLEQGAMTGQLNTTMAVFSLKQLGWRDKHEQEDTSNAVALEAIRLIFEDVKNADK